MLGRRKFKNQDGRYHPLLLLGMFIVGLIWNRRLWHRVFICFHAQLATEPPDVDGPLVKRLNTWALAQLWQSRPGDPQGAEFYGNSRDPNEINGNPMGIPHFQTPIYIHIYTYACIHPCIPYHTITYHNITIHTVTQHNIALPGVTLT